MTDQYGSGSAISIKAPDAVLIAAAPDLLAALEACEDLIGAWINGPLFALVKFDADSPPALYKARAAIAKAKGEA